MSQLLKDISKLKNERDELLEALKNVLPWVVSQPVACHGMKCRESVCESCCGEEYAEEAANKACDAVLIARKAIEKAEATS